jgi:hypothetical protein
MHPKKGIPINSYNGGIAIFYLARSAVGKPTAITSLSINKHNYQTG